MVRYSRWALGGLASLASCTGQGGVPAPELRLDSEQIVTIDMDERGPGPGGLAGIESLQERGAPPVETMPSGETSPSEGSPLAPLVESGPGAAALSDAAAPSDAGAPSDAAAPSDAGAPVAAPQRVFLDFDGGVAAFDVERVRLDGTTGVVASLPSHVYTPEERERIEALVASDVAPLGISVSSSPPAEGEFTTLTFNGPLPIRLIEVAGGGFGVSGSFGDSDSIDHRNRNRSDSAVIAAHLWEFFAFTDPTGASFARGSGLVVDAEHPLAAQLSEAVVQQSANTAAHELGHLLGLRHHDGFGPPGSGLPSSGPTGAGQPSPLESVPPYEGPLEADETTLHLMSTGRTGATTQVRASVDQFFSERSAIKVAIGQSLPALREAEAKVGVLEPLALSAPNPVVVGESAGTAQLDARVLALAGSISEPDEVDEFRFRALAGDAWTIELVSSSDPSFTSPVVTDLSLLIEQSDGSTELVAFNAQIFEGNDPLLLDVSLPADGTYIVQIEAPDVAFIDADGDGFRDDPISLEENGIAELRTGDYEIVAYTVEPAGPAAR